MVKKIVALDVLTGILKKVYNKTKEYTNKKISIEVGSLRSLIGTNSKKIAALQTTTDAHQESIDGLSSNVKDLQGKLGTAESNITTLQSDVATLQSKVYDYLGNDEIDKVFEEA